ncbi:MAG: potassium channel family protein [Acidobacteriota bacterium]
MRWKHLPRLSRAIRLLKTHRLLQITLAIIVMVHAMALLVLMAEYGANKEQFGSFGDALWWSLVTIATVGYGDIVPHTGAGRLIGSVTIVSGLVLISLFTATISSVFIARKLKESQGLQTITFTGHLLICGWNVHIEELLSLFSRLGTKKSAQEIVLVNDAAPERIESLISTFPKLDIRFVRGDYTREAILERANAGEAEAALVLPDTGATGALSDDKTLLALLTLKSLSPKTKVFCHIVNRENLPHIRRAGADDVVISDQHVGFFLANQILNPGAPQVAMEMMNFEHGNDIQTIPIDQAFTGRTFGEYFVRMKQDHNYTVLGIVTEEETMSLNDILLTDTSAIDAFIERKFKEAGINVEERSGVRITVNPPFSYVLKTGDEAVVLGTLEHT